MKTVKDKAIILRRKSFGEADWMLTLLTERHGKVRAIAKGARKVTSRLSGFVELFTIVSCQLNFQASIPIISQISHERLFDGIAENQRLYRSLHVVAEIIDRATHEEDVQPALFLTVADTMANLVGDNRPLALADAMVTLTRLLGLVPQVNVCARCSRELIASDPICWSDADGGLVHASPGDGTVLTLVEVKVIRGLVAGTLPESTIIPSDLAQSVESRLLNHVAFTLDQPLLASRTA
jgi:DNA repair protein RecO (recombination protein O)